MSTLKCSGVTANCPGIDADRCACCPSSQTILPVVRSQSHEPMLPAASARLRRCSLSSSRAVEASSSAVRSRDALLELGVEPLELPVLAIEIGEDADLGAQHLRHDRHRHIVHRAHLVAAQMIDLGEVDRRDEDHRDLLEARMLADHRGELEAVELRHADVHQDDGDLVLEQLLQRLLAGRGLDQILAQLAQDHLIGEQLRGLVVDQQDVDLVVRRHERRPILAVQPHAQRGQQLFGVDRLRQIVGGAGLQALLAIALHRLGGQRDDRQAAVRRASRGSRPSSDSRPSPAS